MRRIMPMLLVLAVVGVARPGLAAERGPVCRESTVVDEMTRQVRARNYYDRIDAKLVSEIPTVDPQVVRCQVCVLSAYYNTPRYGERSVNQCKARGFDVHILSNGFVVRDLQ